MGGKYLEEVNPWDRVISAFAGASIIMGYCIVGVRRLAGLNFSIVPRLLQRLVDKYVQTYKGARKILEESEIPTQERDASLANAIQGLGLECPLVILAEEVRDRKGRK